MNELESEHSGMACFVLALLWDVGELSIPMIMDDVGRSIAQSQRQGLAPVCAAESLSVGTVLALVHGLRHDGLVQCFYRDERLGQSGDRIAVDEAWLAEAAAKYVLDLGAFPEGGLHVALTYDGIEALRRLDPEGTAAADPKAYRDRRIEPIQ